MTKLNKSLVSHRKGLQHWLLQRDGKLRRGDEVTEKLFEVSRTQTQPFSSFHHLFSIFLLYFASFHFYLYLSLSSLHRLTSSPQHVMRYVCVCVCGCTLCALAHARDCSEGWVMLMSGSCVVISEPQAGRQEAAKHLVIWCGLRYRSLGVKLCLCVWVWGCVSERHAESQVRRLGAATCVQKAVRALGPIPRDDAEIKTVKC